MVIQLPLSFLYMFSKKDAEVRAKEILEGCSGALIQTVAENAPIMMREKLSSQVVQEIMLHAIGKLIYINNNNSTIFFSILLINKTCIFIYI